MLHLKLVSFITLVLICYSVSSLSQSITAGMVHLDSVAVYSKIEDYSSPFCTRISDFYHRQIKKGLDSLQKECDSLYEDYARIHATASYFDKRHRSIDTLIAEVESLQTKYGEIQHLLNTRVEKFTIQEVFRHTDWLKDQYGMVLLSRAPPLFEGGSSGSEQGKLVNFTEELIRIIDQSAGLEKRWKAFQQEVIMELKKLEVNTN